jgi:hypothetical protein
MKSLRFSRIGGTLIFLLLVATFLAFAMSGRLTFAHAAAAPPADVMVTVHISPNSPVKSVYASPYEGGPEGGCISAPGGSIKLPSNSPIHMVGFTGNSTCKYGPHVKNNNLDFETNGTNMTVNVP